MKCHHDGEILTLSHVVNECNLLNEWREKALYHLNIHSNQLLDKLTKQSWNCDVEATFLKLEAVCAPLLHIHKEAQKGKEW